MTEDDIAKWAEAFILLRAITDELGMGMLHHSINGRPLDTPEEILAALIEDGEIIVVERRQ